MNSTQPVPAVVFVGNSESVFVTRTSAFFVARNVEVSVIDPYRGHSGLRRSGLPERIARIFARMKHVAHEARLRSPSETAVVHSLSLDVFWLVPLLKRRLRRVVLICYGSDVLRRDARFDWLLKIGLSRLDGIAATNHNVLDCLKKDFPCVLPLDPCIVRFGLPVFDALDTQAAVSKKEAKQQLGLDAEKQIVCLGYSACAGQRQLELIEFFANRISAFEGYQFVVPVQYGEVEIVDAVKTACAKANEAIRRRQFLPLVEFHDITQSALMRKATDILVNHSVSDAFSGTVQEVIYAGNLVLASSSLPYRTMPSFGTAIRTYDTLSEIEALLSPENLESWRRQGEVAETQNREQLRTVSSWEAVRSDWEALIVGPER